MPKMTLREFLELSKDLRADPRFHLSNQDLVAGFVRFRSEERLRLLQEMLTYHNDGWLPPSTIKKKAIAKSALDKFGFNMAAFVKSLSAVSGPDGSGWYRAECPNCARLGKDQRSQGRLSFNPDLEIVHCHSTACTWKDVVRGYIKEDAA